MTRVFFACLLVALGFAMASAGARDPVPLPLSKGARIGILNMMDSEVTHFHNDKILAQSFFKTIPVNWQVESMLNDAVSARLTQQGLVPVMVAMSDALAHGRDEVFVDNSVAKGLPKETARQFADLASAEHLDALIVLAPGLNDSAHAGSALRRGLPNYLRGWGFVTSDTGEKPSLFNMNDLLLVGVGPEGAVLRAREWGGLYADDWNDYVPPANLKQFPPDVLDQLQPLYGRLLSRQASRLLDWIKLTP